MLKVLQNKGNPKIIAFLRRHENRTLLVVANKDMNAFQHAKIKIPGLSPLQQLQNLAPTTGLSGTLVVNAELLEANLAPGKFCLFEITLPPRALPS